MFSFSEIAYCFYLQLFRLVRGSGFCGCYRRKGHQQRIFKRTGLSHIRMWHDRSFAGTFACGEKHLVAVFGRNGDLLGSGIVWRMDS